MILQIDTDARMIQNDWDIKATQVISRPDPGQHQELGAFERPGGEHKLPSYTDLGLHPILKILQSCRAFVGYDNLGGSSVCGNCKIRLVHHRPQIGFGARHPPPSANVYLKRAEPVLFCPIEIRIRRKAKFTGSI